VLAGKQLYLFASEHSPNHQLQLNLQQLQIRLIDTEHLATKVTLNPTNKEVLELFFESGADMNRWLQNIEKCLASKEQSKLDTSKNLQPKPMRLLEERPQTILTDFKSRQSINEGANEQQPRMKK
jgi:hypothetical protein